jgi:hypothetical protein
VLPSGSGHDAAITAARNADLAVVFVNKFESEGSDLSDISLPADQNQLVTDVAAANPNTVVVVNSGSAVAMPWAGAVRGIVESWYPGQEYGNALASLLFGDVNPSGKLPVTFPAALTDVPARTTAQWPGQNNTVQYSEGLGVGYRWYDQQNITPLFPFGFGLSYTSFGYANLAVAAPDAAGNVAVSFDVTNTGSRAGAEVAQVYVGQPASAGEPPKNLRGFAKVSLAPGQTQRVTVTLDARSFQFFSGGWATAAGSHQILVGSSSRDIRLTGDVERDGVDGSSAYPMDRDRRTQQHHRRPGPDAGRPDRDPVEQRAADGERQHGDRRPGRREDIQPGRDGFRGQRQRLRPRLSDRGVDRRRHLAAGRHRHRHQRSDQRQRRHPDRELRPGDANRVGVVVVVDRRVQPVHLT